MSKVINRAHSRAPLQICLLVLILSACAVVRAPEHTRIALFAPFEGRYREVGYNALYAARLALAEPAPGTTSDGVDLLAVDSGGTEAANHAKALAQDPLVMAAVVLGYDGTSPEVLQAFGNIPVLIAGDWGAQPTGDNVFILSNPQIDQQLTAPSRIDVIDAAQIAAPVIGGDVFALEGFAKLRASLDGVTVLSSGTLPDENFIQRYKAGDQFAPEPGLLAKLTYDATGIALWVARTGSRDPSRSFIIPDLFVNGYDRTRTIHTYHYVNGSLAEDVVK